MSVASLNATLEEQKRLKYDSALESELRQWIATFLGEPQLNDTSKSLQSLLKDGSVLCRIANKIHAGLVPRINTSTLAFKQMENITTYLAACSALGFHQGELFDTTDLYENKDFMRVLLHMNVLRKFSEKYTPEEIRKLLDDGKQSQPATSIFSSGGSTTSGSVSKGRSRSGVLNRAAVQQRYGGLSNPSSPVIPEQTATPPASPGHKRSGSAYGRTPASPLKSNDSSTSTSSTVSLGSPSPSRAAVIEVSSLHDDVATKEEFKYSHEVEGIAQRWIEAVLKEKFPPGVTFANALKSGVLLCRLINVIKPGSVAKINTANIAYLQMENIEHYLKACSAFGLRNSDLFDTTDLFEAKKMSIVVSHIIVLGNTVKKMETWNGPIIEDSKHAKNLWAESLNMNEIDEAELEKAEEGKPIPPEQQEWIDWANTQLAKRDWKPIKNLTVNLKSGVILSRLLEVLIGQDIPYVSEPKYLWQYINNVTMALRVLAAHTFELVPGCNAREIVNGSVPHIITLLHYLRDKFDLEYLFNKVLGEDIDDDEMDVIESETLQWKITPTWLPEPPAPPIQQTASNTSTNQSNRTDVSASASPAPIVQASPVVKDSASTSAPGFIGRPKDPAYSPRQLPTVSASHDKAEPTPDRSKPTHHVGHQPLPAVQPSAHPIPHTHAPTSPGRTPGGSLPSLEDKKFSTPASPRGQYSPGRSPQLHSQQPTNVQPEQKHDVTAKQEAASQPGQQQPTADDKPLSPRVASQLTPPVAEPGKKVKRTSSHREKKPKKLKDMPSKSLSDRDLKKQEMASKAAADKEREKEEKKEKRKEEKREKEKKKEQKERKKEEKKKKRKEEKKKERKIKHKKAPSTAGPSVEAISQPDKKIVPAQHDASKEEPSASKASTVAQQSPRPTPATPPVTAAVPLQKPVTAADTPISPRIAPADQPLQSAQKGQSAPVPSLTVPARPNGSAIPDRPVGSHVASPGQATLRRAAQAAAELKREKARNVVRKRVVDEILSTETSYVRSLEIVVEQVVTPLKAAATSQSKVLSDAEMSSVFMNISSLLAHHERFLGLVKERVTSWNPRSTIGDIFLLHTDFIKEYGQYLSNYNTALVTLRHLVEKRPTLKKIKEAFELYQLKTTALTLDAFLIMPVQRVPRYVLLLKELLKYSNPGHPDYAYLEKAHAKVKSILDELNRGIDEEAHVRVQKIISIEDDVEGILDHLPDGLYNPQRRLLREGLLNLRITHRGARRKDSLRSFQKQFYFFAFNDLLVCCGRREQEKPAKSGKAKESATEGGKSFRYASSIYFKDVESIGDGMAPEQHDAEALQSKLMHIQFAFHLATPHVAWTLVCSSEQEKQEWMSLARQAIANPAKKG